MEWEESEEEGEGPVKGVWSEKEGKGSEKEDEGPVKGVWSG